MANTLTLRTGRPTLGLLAHGAGDPNSHRVWAGVASVAQERDVNLICFPGKPLRSPLEFEAQSNILYELVSAQSIDGLVIWSAGLPLFVDRPEMNAFCQRFRPLPMVTAGVPIEGIPGVTVDNYRGMPPVVSHLIEVHGRARIAFIRGPEYHQEAEERYRAYLDVLADHRIPYDADLVVHGNFKESGGAAAAEQLLSGCRDGFDALVAASDNMAIGALHVLQSHGLRVPGDVAIAGLNDESQSPFITPPLTTGPLHFHEQARRATEMLLALLAGASVTGQVILPTQLLIRQSCGCPDPLVTQAAVEPGNRADVALAVALRITAERAEDAESIKVSAHSAHSAVKASSSWGTPHAAWIADLHTRREPIIAEMMLATEAAPTEAAAHQAAQLLDGFAAEIAGRAPGAFLEALGDGLRRSAAAEEPISWWQGALSALRRELIANACEPAELSRAENLWQQARVMIGETAQRVQAYRLLQTEEQARTLGAINQMLSTAIDLPELTEILARALPQLGIPSCYLALYEHPDDPTGFCRLMVAYDRQGRIALEPEGRRFPARQLVPEGLLRAERRHSLVVEPLYFREDQLGFVLFEADPGQEEGLRTSTRADQRRAQADATGCAQRRTVQRGGEGARGRRGRPPPGRGCRSAQEPFPRHREPRTAHAAQPDRRHHRDDAARRTDARKRGAGCAAACRPSARSGEHSLQRPAPGPADRRRARSGKQPGGRAASRQGAAAAQRRAGGGRHAGRADARTSAAWRGRRTSPPSCPRSWVTGHACNRLP